MGCETSYVWLFCDDSVCLLGFEARGVTGIRDGDNKDTMGIEEWRVEGILAD